MNWKKKILGITSAVLMAMAVVTACKEKAPEAKKQDITEIRKLEKEELVARGQYLVTIGGCNDCHSPKILTPTGPVLDTTRILSGYPAERGIPVLSEAIAKDQQWVKMAPDATAFVGPWGMSFGSNLTADSATGIGSWSEEVFIKTIRTGKHLGQEGGRPILPPMPWFMVAKMTDQDLSAVYHYLQQLPAISNRVPAPIAPQELAIKK